MLSPAAQEGQPPKPQSFQLLYTYVSRCFFTLSTQCPVQQPWNCPCSISTTSVSDPCHVSRLLNRKGGFILHKKVHGTRSMSTHLGTKSRDSRERAVVSTGQFVPIAFFWWCSSLPVTARSQGSPEGCLAVPFSAG